MSNVEYRDEEFGYVLLDLSKPAIAWLPYVGVIYSADVPDANPGNISWWLISVLSRATAPRFEREATFERIRLAEFLAPLVGSKLGHVAPWVKIEGDELVFTYIIRYDDNEGPEVLRRAIERAQQDRSFPINHRDLEPLGNANLAFCVPDFRPFEVRVPAENVAQFSQLVADRPQPP
jgi:hypothetical protein